MNSTSPVETVSRRAYGSKIRSRHSAGTPGPWSATPIRTIPIWCEPADGGGARFVVALPAVVAL